ncbi:MAG TPA: FecR domain-containing protein, partial [Flavitalea sp.]|nr:FecR domain-containing protein [Flavitalea sp.]
SEQQLADRIRDRLLETISTDKQMVSERRRKWQIPVAAACILLVLFSSGMYLLFSTRHPRQETAKVSNELKLKNDIAPGGNKAVLTLSNGATILLDSASVGTITRQGNINVQKLANGLVAYDVNDKQAIQSDHVSYNVITTPRGGQYQITLADGTKVWLNAASSIRFPVAFTGKERKVEITGEAYFEVAPNKDMPFKVEANFSEIEVLGTHFSINAYSDEASIKTTLLEGKVKIAVPAMGISQSPRFLLPGQQADINKEGKISVMDDADTEAAVAWMHGYFQFKNADLQSILRQIARWYDIDVEYNGKVNLHFTGQLTRNDNVSKVFKELALTGEVHFRIDGKRIIVSP